ncbi:MAG: hypothetical protein HRU19_29975 [Pseudobacteriovorax sp.]|nr:hypothetical protein [Pseudobacteriovorax sp.]
MGAVMTEKMVSFWEVLRTTVIEYTGFTDKSKKGELKIKYDLTEKENRKLRRFMRSEVQSIRPTEEDEGLMKLLRQSLQENNLDSMWQKISDYDFPEGGYLVSESEIFGEIDVESNPAFLGSKKNLEYFILVMTCFVSSGDLALVPNGQGLKFVEKMKKLGFLSELEGRLEVNTTLTANMLPMIGHIFGNEDEKIR